MKRDLKPDFPYEWSGIGDVQNPRGVHFLQISIRDGVLFVSPFPFKGFYYSY